MKAEMTEIVMPGDANHLGTCFGGKIMSWVDMVAAIAAQRLVGTVVTASVDRIEFKKPIKVGDIVTLLAKVNAVWNSSMEVGVKVLIQSPKEVDSLEWGLERWWNEIDKPVQACKAYLTFVAVDSKGNRRNVNDYALFIDDTTREEEANQRRKIRLENKK